METTEILLIVVPWFLCGLSFYGATVAKSKAEAAAPIPERVGYFSQEQGLRFLGMVCGVVASGITGCIILVRLVLPAIL